jgi:hypothetical protein
MKITHGVNPRLASHILANKYHVEQLPGSVGDVLPTGIGPKSRLGPPAQNLLNQNVDLVISGTSYEGGTHNPPIREPQPTPQQSRGKITSGTNMRLPHPVVS